MWATGKEYLTSPSAGQLLFPLPIWACSRVFLHARPPSWRKPVTRNLKMGQVRVGGDRLPQVEWSRSGGAKPVTRNLEMGQVRVGRDRFPQVWVAPLLTWACSRVFLRTPAGVQGGRPPC
jgi:hypothetical protein